MLVYVGFPYTTSYFLYSYEQCGTVNFTIYTWCYSSLIPWEGARGLSGEIIPHVSGHTCL